MNNKTIPHDLVLNALSPRHHAIEAEDIVDEHHLGQFIPLHYHYGMLANECRMTAFKQAIDFAVFNDAKVLELGGGTGVLSCFAAEKASKVWCVELNPELVLESRRLLALNKNGDKVEVVQADASEYLPPEPVDVVICEMIHPAMLREKQIEVIENFKVRYQQRFGDKLPVFIPEAVLMAVQPVQQDFDFFGYHAPIIMFQRAHAEHHNTTELAPPLVYSTIDFTLQNACKIECAGNITISADGVVNALRFITKNIVLFEPDQSGTIDWIVDYIVLPLSEPVGVKAGDMLNVSFQYLAGGSIRSLERSIHATIVR